MNGKAKVLRVIRWPPSRAVAGAAETLYREGTFLAWVPQKAELEANCARKLYGRTSWDPWTKGQ